MTIAELPKDVKQVIETIKAAWGFEVTAEYAQALIAFIDEMTKARNENQSR